MLVQSKLATLASSENIEKKKYIYIYIYRARERERGAISIAWLEIKYNMM